MKPFGMLLFGIDHTLIDGCRVGIILRQCLITEARIDIQVLPFLQWW